MWFGSNQEEEEEVGMLNFEDDYVNYDAFPSFTPEQGEGVGGGQQYEGVGGGGSDDYTNVMDQLVNMKLLDADGFWDPALLACEGLENMDLGKQDDEGEEKSAMHNAENSHLGEQSGQDLAVVFFEWLKSNKDLISAEDLRSIKLKTSTIESAAKRLGGGKEAMQQLLSLILEWVKYHQLQKKKKSEEENSSYHMEVSYDPNPSLGFNPYSVPNMPHQQYYVSESAAVYPPMMYGYHGNSFYNTGALHSAQSWPPPSTTTHYIDFSEQNISPSPRTVAPVETRSFIPFGSTLSSQLYPSQTDPLAKTGTSSTKEARKNRMARQKRVFSNGRSYIDHRQQQVTDTRHANVSNCTQLPNWQLQWPSSPSDTASPSSVLMSEPPPPPPPPQIQAEQQIIHSPEYHQHSSLDAQQVCLTGPGKDLKLLLQKVLKQTDVTSLGRIVLPKKEAETFLPSLEGRGSIIIAMEDAATTRIWNMRYRFWPNNKNRMYMLENAGEFVRSNGLREGDFIVIYADMRYSKYLIRGVKVRKIGAKSEATKQGKAHKYHHTNPMASSSSAKGKVR